MFYYTIFGILALFALLEMVVMPANQKKWIYIIIMSVFVILGGLRWHTGNDWRPYESFYTTFKTDNPFDILTFERGFTLFVRFLRIFSDSFTFYLCVLSILTIGMKAIFFYRFTGAVFVAVLLYWGTQLSDIIAVRQSLAISLCTISTIFIVDKKPFHFLFVVFLATQIHVTTIIFVIAYPLFYADWSVRWKYILLVVSIFIGVLGTSEILLHLATNYAPGVLGLDRIAEKAQDYMDIGNETTYGQSLDKTQRIIAAVAKRAILLPVFFFFQNRFTDKDKNYKGFLNLYTFGNVLFFMVIDFLTLQRLASYFYIFEIILFCIIFTQVKSKGVWLTVIILYSLFKLLSLVISLYDFIVPYIWIFSNDTFRYKH